jgi:hypothetical protein
VAARDGRRSDFCECLSFLTPPRQSPSWRSILVRVLSLCARAGTGEQGECGTTVSPLDGVGTRRCSMHRVPLGCRSKRHRTQFARTVLLFFHIVSSPGSGTCGARVGHEARNSDKCTFAQRLCRRCDSNAPFAGIGISFFRTPHYVRNNRNERDQGNNRDCPVKRSFSWPFPSFSWS